MTESTPWQSPAGTTPQQPPTPYSSEQLPPPAPGSRMPAAPAGGPTPGWTPPPKPGLIPLRPLTLGTILGAAFQVMRRNPRPTFGFALLISGITYVTLLVIVGFVTFFAFSRIQQATGPDADTVAAGSVGLIVLSAIVPVALSVVGNAILQGIISLEVARATLGEKLRLGGLWRAAKGRIGTLIAWAGLVAGAVVAGVLVVALIVVLATAVGVGVGGATGGAVGVLLGVFLFFVVGLAGLALIAWLTTKLALVPSVIMLERLGLRAAIARSWSLTRNVFWRTFGILLLVYAILQIAGSIIAAPLQIIVSFGTTLLDPNSSNTGLIAGAAVVYVLTIVFAVVFGAIAAVVQSATPALLYIDIRMRKEGLDLELSRFVEARQAGDTSVADPYAVRTADGAASPGPAGSPWS